MKGLTTFRLIAGSVILTAGAIAPKAQAQPAVLGHDMFVRMDSNQDKQVSKSEYVDYGSAYLKKRGKRVNRAQIETKFREFDRDGDGFITDRDPEFRSPKELLAEKITGTWSSGKGIKDSISFVFMDGNQADVVQNGESMREKARGKMKYKFVHPSRTPTCLDIIVDRGTDSDFYIKCIIEFISDDQMKLRMVSGSALTARPRKFPAGGSSDIILLNRISQAETPLVNEARAYEKSQKRTMQEAVVHRGNISAKVKVERDSDKRVKREEERKPAGLMVTTTVERSEEEVQSLDISIINGGPKRDTFQLCWYFFCRPHEGKAVRVYDKGAKEITLDPRKRTTHNVVSKKVSVVKRSVEKENYDTGNSTDPVTSIRGDKAEGYLVLLKHNDVILDKKSHSSKFMADQWLSKL